MKQKRESPITRENDDPKAGPVFKKGKNIAPRKDRLARRRKALPRIDATRLAEVLVAKGVLTADDLALKN